MGLTKQAIDLICQEYPKSELLVKSQLEREPV